MKTPEVIYLVRDYDDESHIVWQSDQPASHDDGVMYIRADSITKYVTQQADPADKTFYGEVDKHGYCKKCGLVAVNCICKPHCYAAAP